MTFLVMPLRLSQTRRCRWLPSPFKSLVTVGMWSGVMFARRGVQTRTAREGERASLVPGEQGLRWWVGSCCVQTLFYQQLENIRAFLCGGT